MDQLLLYPANREEARKELKKLKDHKWLFVTFDPDMIIGIKKYMRHFFGEDKRLIVINGDKEMEAFMGKDELDFRRFVGITGLGHERVNIQDMTFKNTDGEKQSISFIYAGMEEKEIEKHYKKFLNKARGMILNNKRGEE